MLIYEKPVGCCNDQQLLDFEKMEVPEVRINFTDRNLWISMATICFNPIFWNFVARLEYRTHFMSRFMGKPKRGVILLAVIIVSLGIYRDWRFKVMMDSQPSWSALYENWILLAGYVSILVGTVLVLSSVYALGFYGTFLGDYFGILMQEKVTGFPFNIVSDPMYVGSALNFLGSAVVKASQAGIVVSLFIGLCYGIAAHFERQFTSCIYNQRDKKAV